MMMYLIFKNLHFFCVLLFVFDETFKRDFYAFARRLWTMISMSLEQHNGTACVTTEPQCMRFKEVS